MTNEKMTIEEFELCVIEHGAEPDIWPDDARSRAGALLAEAAGQQVLKTHRELSDHFEASDQILVDDTSENAFLTRLIDIPIDVAAVSPELSANKTEQGIFDRLFERIFSLSPSGLTSQAAGVGAVLLMGFIVGMSDSDSFYQGDGEVEEVVDLSDSYFADSGLYFEEGIE
jgi:hypothetical protein